jgi:uncharacterized protein (DUF2147 family)
MRIVIIITGLLFSVACYTQTKADTTSIVGRWMSSEKNLEVEVYQRGTEFKARVIWFDDSDDKSNPMSTRCDKKNPDKSLRSRKVLGLEVLNGLTYNNEDKGWQDGQIYNPSSGKDWNAKAWLTSDGRLKVRGFWHF